MKFKIIHSRVSPSDLRDKCRQLNESYR